jgi:hypothetical protein
MLSQKITEANSKITPFAGKWFLARKGAAISMIHNTKTTMQTFW